MNYFNLRSRIAELMGVDYADTTVDSNGTIAYKLGAWLNSRYKLLAGKRSWNWLIKDTILQTQLQITTGTVSLVNASASITFSSGPAVSVANCWIQFGDSEDWYIVSAHTAASTSATLTTPFLGTTNGSQTFTIRKVYYSLPSDCLKVLTIRETRQDNKLTYVPVRMFDEVVADRTAVDVPIYYTIVGLDSSSTYRVEVYPVPGVTMNLSLRYYAIPTSLSADADIPLMPEAFHDYLVWDVLATYGYNFIDDTRIVSADRNRKEIYADMVRNEITGEEVAKRREFDNVWPRNV